MIDKVKIAGLFEDVERLSNREYEALSLEYEINPPELSGAPGFLTSIYEQI